MLHDLPSSVTGVADHGVSMLTRAKVFFPGERVRMIAIAACIGVMSGLAIIVFREAVDLAKELVMAWGYDILGIDQGGWRRLLLPLCSTSR